VVSAGSLARRCPLGDGSGGVAVDDIREEERIVTVYEPDKERWSADFKVRKL
jgi:hypothetical protein